LKTDAGRVDRDFDRENTVKTPWFHREITAKTPWFHREITVFYR
jgi:hypothetical protein